MEVNQSGRTEWQITAEEFPLLPALIASAGEEAAADGLNSKAAKAEKWANFNSAHTLSNMNH